MSGIGEDLIGGTAIGEDPSPYANGAAAAIIAGQDRVIYACEIDARIRQWALAEAYEDAIGVNAIGEGSESISPSAAIAPIYIATEPFVTDSDQTPANRLFNGRAASISMKRSINNGTDFGGVALGDGEVAINNADGVLDGRIAQTVAGQTVVIKMGAPGIPYEYWSVVFRGTARDWTFDERLIRIALRDRSYRLSVAAQSITYAGSGGAEGGDDLAGKRKPKVLGTCNNLSPPQVDAANLVYQIHDGALDAVFGVRDRGGALTFGADRADYAALVAASIAGGSYDTCLAEGLIRLGAAPDGTVTADAATYRSTGKAPLATIIRGLIEDETDIDDFYEGAFSVLLALYPNDAGIYLDENDNSSVLDVVEELLRGVAGFLYFTRDGQCSVRVINIPDNPSRMYFGLSSVLDLSLDRLPSRLYPPPWRLRLAYAQNFTTQQDLAGSVDPYYAQPSKLVTDSDTDVLLDEPLAQDGAPVDSYLVDAADAAAEVERQFAIFKQSRLLRRARLSRRAATLELGDVVDLGFDRLGGRRLGIVVEDELDVPEAEGDIDTVEVVLYG